MELKTKHYGDISGWVEDSYIMLTHSELPIYSKGDFEVLSLDIVRDLPTNEEFEKRIVKELGQHYVDEHKRKSRKLTDADIPTRLSSDNIYQKIFYRMYYINIKASNSYDAAHRHCWDTDTLHNCFEYLRNHLSQNEQVVLIPYEQYQNICFVGCGGFNNFERSAKRIDINLANYKHDKQITQLLLDYFFVNLINVIDEKKREFIIRNDY
jgi:hypothetical protein